MNEEVNFKGHSASFTQSCQTLNGERSTC